MPISGITSGLGASADVEAKVRVADCSLTLTNDFLVDSTYLIFSDPFLANHAVCVIHACMLFYFNIEHTSALNLALSDH
jgi:hypothetical protein